MYNNGKPSIPDQYRKLHVQCDWQPEKHQLFSV